MIYSVDYKPSNTRDKNRTVMDNMASKEENLFVRVAKALIRNGLIAGKAEAFVLHLLSKSKQQMKYPIIHNKIMEIDSEGKGPENMDDPGKEQEEIKDECKEADKGTKSSDVIVSDLEPDIPEERVTEEYVPDEEFEEEVDHSSYLKVATAISPLRIISCTPCFRF